MLNEKNELYRKLQLELYWCWNFFQEDLIILKMSDQLKSVRHPFVLFQAIDLQLIIVVLPGHRVFCLFFAICIKYEY